MRHSRHLVERFIDDELYIVFANGADWESYTDLDDAKEVADDLYSNFGKSVKVCDSDGKVVYRPRFNVESRRPRGRMLREGQIKSKDFMKQLVEVVENNVHYDDDYYHEMEPSVNGGESWDGFINFTDGTIDYAAEFNPLVLGKRLYVSGVDAVSNKNAEKVQKLVYDMMDDTGAIKNYFEDCFDKVNDMLPETAKPFKSPEDAYEWYINFEPNYSGKSDQYDLFGGTSMSGEEANAERYYEELNDEVSEYIMDYFSESPAYIGVLVTLHDDREEGKVCNVMSYVNDDYGYGREVVGAWAGKNVIGEGIGNHYIYDQSFTWKNLSDLKRNLAKHVALAAKTIGAN